MLLVRSSVRAMQMSHAPRMGFVGVRRYGGNSSAAKETTDEDFENDVLKAADPVVVQFHATWCGPCKMFAPVLESAVQKSSKVKLVKVDVDDCPNTSADMNISAVPTIMAFHKGKKVKSFTGALSSSDTASFIKELDALN
eukprot:TRINITY_DN1000_c0_g2_i2.p1 TRINITY_DN1000_c0_g2~~TRINITY_DN1000_c0_g2_i2.p1  ORF type:complete len:140 (-),score=38.08 TRINITY_DN1000_c0_g2_i2:69-488(-)